MTTVDKDYPIVVDNITKSFKVYLDKAQNLKDAFLYIGRRKFERRQVLKGISFHVKKGEALALIGHNGCGKSTTLKMLTRIMYPDTGTITMKGRVSSLIELGAGFHPDMSGRENIYINASIFGLTKEEIDARVDTIINFSELQDYIDNPVRTYSSGMYMRLAFSIAINVDADILLIDEILAVGDANFQQKCYAKMRELKESGITIVIVTHDMGTVRSFCDYAIWINDGKIKLEGDSSYVADCYLAYMTGETVEKAHDNGDEKITMDPSQPHYGNQKAIIKSCRMFNEKGENTTIISSEESYSLKFHYETSKDFDVLLFGVAILNKDCNVLIYATGDKISINNQREGMIEFKSEPLHLSGEFVLSVSIMEKDTTPCDCYCEYLHFHVINPVNTTGLITYKTDWKTLQ